VRSRLLIMELTLAVVEFRFLIKMKEPEILESLIPSITANLEHRHSYVRKNAVLTVFTVFQAYPELIPDAPELIEKFMFAVSACLFVRESC
jgi:coatomer subunit beta